MNEAKYFRTDVTAPVANFTAYDVFYTVHSLHIIIGRILKNPWQKDTIILLKWQQQF